MSEKENARVEGSCLRNFIERNDVNILYLRKKNAIKF